MPMNSIRSCVGCFFLDMIDDLKVRKKSATSKGVALLVMVFQDAHLALLQSARAKAAQLAFRVGLATAQPDVRILRFAA